MPETFLNILICDISLTVCLINLVEYQVVTEWQQLWKNKELVGNDTLDGRQWFNFSFPQFISWTS